MLVNRIIFVRRFHLRLLHFQFQMTLHIQDLPNTMKINRIVFKNSLDLQCNETILNLYVHYVAYNLLHITD